MNKLKDKINVVKTNAQYVLNNKSGAALWEYLLLIAIVVIVGGVLLNSIDGSIGTIWDDLMAKLRTLFQLTD